MSRAYGSNAHLLLKRESAYGTQATGNFNKMPFVSNALGSEQGLIASQVLGFGRDPAEPFLDVINVDGDIGVPVDPRYLGFWLTGLFGDPTTTPIAATGTITFGSNPSEGHTITINGTVFTFIAGASAGTDIQIKGSAALTAAEVVSVLNLSADTDVDDATYSNPSGAIVLVTHDTAGPGGNAFTLAASNATLSGATLSGGHYSHEFESGGTSLPSYSLEGGMPEVPAFFVHTGVVMNSIAFNFQRSGAALATINAIAQAETRFDATQGGTPVELDLDFISQFKGRLRSGGSVVGNLTSANLAYSNNCERIETIRSDGKIDGVDPSVASLTGSFDMRFADTTFIDAAADGDPIDLEFSYILETGLSLTIEAHEVWLPKPKLAVSGPGGIQGSFAFQGAREASEGKMLTVTLANGLAGSTYTS